MRYLLLLAALLAMPVWAAIEPLEFDDPQQQTRYRLLIDELRCPTCQNQNIAESNAPLANDLRQRVHLMITEGHDDHDIRAYMVQRYGDFITYRPPVRPLTWILWFGPFIVLIGVVIALAIWIRRRNREPLPQLDGSDRERLSRLLEKHSGGSS